MADFSLSVGADTVVGAAADDTVYGTAATLNAGDRLTGGAGADALVLVGSGSFRVDQLATFAGFESIKLSNATSSTATLTLGSQPIEFDASGSSQILVNSLSSWNGSNIINGDASHTWSTTYLNFWNDQPLPITYDLTSNTFSHASMPDVGVCCCAGACALTDCAVMLAGWRHSSWQRRCRREAANTRLDRNATN
jgi:hypothetical protein